MLRATLVPARRAGHPLPSLTFVAILGTTISPYLFFWQAAQEVEEERAAGKETIAQRDGRDGRRAARGAHRRGDGDVLLELRHVLHHPHHRAPRCTRHGRPRSAPPRRPRRRSGRWPATARTGSSPSGSSARACSACRCSPARGLRHRRGGGWRGSLDASGRRPRAVLRRARRRDGARAGAGFRRARRGRDALLVGRGERRARAAADRAGRCCSPATRR